MKKILMIGTGGTIASEMTPEGLTPEITSEQLLKYIPRIAEICWVECRQLYSLDSTNLMPEHWLGVAETICRQYDDYDGFVISHGTDTMWHVPAWSSAREASRSSSTAKMWKRSSARP